MDGLTPLKAEDKWLLAIVNLLPYVEGRTRLQKFGMLSFYEVLKDEEFFDDWRPSHYGGYSSRLADSLKRLKAGGYVRADKVTVERDCQVNRYSLTEEGRHAIAEFETNSSRLEKIKTILSHYFTRTLNDLLADVYQRYPELAANSKIIAGVNRASDPGPRMERESETRIGEQPGETRMTIPAHQHVLGDMDFREKLAKSIGLDRVPDLDPQAFERIQGILSEHIGTDHFDAVEAVREVRDC
ncbi:MAG: PadR family transcriptional regulator [Thaumarchaeota archaeon]|nr:PadR family transcriptional regulator [Nitrososphaerota archaeon]